MASAAALLNGFRRLWNAGMVSGPGVGTAAKNRRIRAMVHCLQHHAGCGPEHGALSSFWGLLVSRCWDEAGAHLLRKAPVQGRDDPGDVGGRDLDLVHAPAPLLSVTEESKPLSPWTAAPSQTPTRWERVRLP